MGAVLAKIYQHQMSIFGDLEYMLDLHVLELNMGRMWTLFLTSFYFLIYQVWFYIVVAPFQLITYITFAGDVDGFEAFEERFKQTYAWMDVVDAAEGEETAR